MKLRISIWLGVVLLVVSAAAVAHDGADLVLRNGKIVTVDVDNPEAQALAARDGLIIAIGSNQYVSPYIGATTKVIDLDGALAIPGFIKRSTQRRRDAKAQSSAGLRSLCALAFLRLCVCFF